MNELVLPKQTVGFTWPVGLSLKVGRYVNETPLDWNARAFAKLEGACSTNDPLPGSSVTYTWISGGDEQTLVVAHEVGETWDEWRDRAYNALITELSINPPD